MVCVLSFAFVSASVHAEQYTREINGMAIDMARKIAKKGSKTVAVVDFIDLRGNVLDLGRFLAEEFSAALVNSGKGFEVVDRTHMKSIIKEAKLSMKGITNPETAKQLGKVAGADSLVAGTIIPSENSVRVIIKAFNTETAKIISVVMGNISKTSFISGLLKNREENQATSTAKSSQGITARPSNIPKTKKTMEHKGFTIELLECKMTGKTVNCSFFITSKENDKVFRLCKTHNYHNSRTCQTTRVFDDFGNEYAVNAVRLANKVTDKLHVDSLLISGIRTKAILYFENVSQKTRTFPLLQLFSNGWNVQFRNVVLSK